MRKKLLLLISVIVIVLSGCTNDETTIKDTIYKVQETIEYSGISIPAYAGEPWVVINNNKPMFEDFTDTSEFELYSELDELGRCGVAFANICQNIMPTEERGEIGHIKPSGWHTIKYDCVDGKYLYNRCHLIGYQLAGENANEKNLITGTRYLNIQGMLDFENDVASYVKSTNNHVLYRVTPVFIADELVARGVVMEGYSVEDSGKGIEFCVFAYNVQPDVYINYADGSSSYDSFVQTAPAETKVYHKGDTVYIVNRNTHKFHLESCSYADSISEENREVFEGEIDWLLDNNYTPCGVCKPDER